MEEIQIEILKEHLPYELDMLDEATTYLQSIEFADSIKETRRGAVWFKRNANIEAFWTHSRNLIEFLTRPKSVDLTVSSASARDFADKFEPSLDMGPLMTLINEQVSHLGYGRKSRIIEKLGVEMNYVKPALDSHIKRFEGLLNPECRKYWVARTPVHMLGVQHDITTSTYATSLGLTMPGRSSK